MKHVISNMKSFLNEGKINDKMKKFLYNFFAEEIPAGVDQQEILNSEEFKDAYVNRRDRFTYDGVEYRIRKSVE